MIAIAIVSLLLGIVCGKWIFSSNEVALFANIADWALYLLMFAVGISVGGNKTVLKKLRQYNLKILLIPAGIVVGSVAGGAVASLFLSRTLRESICIASGLGWYSLSGVLLRDLISPEIGTVAFLANLMRELLAFLSIPMIAKHLNYYTAIAPAAATSEDTTLPMFVKYTSEDIVVIAVLNGILCSAVVPVLLQFFNGIFLLME